MEVTAVVVTYNRLELLKECISSLQQQEAENFNILVVDNKSTDGTREYLNTLSDTDVQLLFLEENMGGAGGFYYGIQKALEDGADAVWIMDDDTIPQKDALKKLLEADRLLHHDYGYLASDVRWIDGKACEMNRVHVIKKDTAAYDRIDIASFVSLLIPAERIQQVGLPIKEYFIWGDDKEYTLRISDRWPCYFVPQSRVVHKMKTNVGSNICTDEITRVQRYFYAYRNDYATAKKRGIKSLALYNAGFYLNMFRVLFKAKDHKKQRLDVMIRGRREGKNFLRKE